MYFIHLKLILGSHQIYRSDPTCNAFFPRKSALLPILAKFGQRDDVIFLLNYRPFFSSFRNIPPRKSFFEVLISMRDTVMAVVVGKMFICLQIGAKSFEDRSQDIRK